MQHKAKFPASGMILVPQFMSLMIGHCLKPTYHDVNDGQDSQMGNEVRSKVLGKGSIELVLTSGKKIVLANVLHVPEMNRNLVSGGSFGQTWD